MSRFVTFLINCVNSENPVIRHLIDIANCSFSLVGMNIREALYQVNVPYLNSNISLSTCKKQLLHFYSHADAQDVCLAIAIRDLCAFRDGKDYAFLTQNDVLSMIINLCIS
jgi:hypothetical protein